MHIAIIGSGAIGSSLGALLARSGQEVTLIGRPEQVAALQHAGGLQVDGALGAFTVPLAAATSLTVRPDLALLAVKTQDVAAAVQDNLDVLYGVPVLTCQNGVRSDAIVAELLPPATILSAVVAMNAVYADPGRVTITYPGTLLVGRPFAALDHTAHEVSRVLNGVVPTRLAHNITGAHWLKLIVNLNNALAAITNHTFGEIVADPYLGRLSIELMREGLRVVKRAGTTLESLPEVTVGLLRLVSWLPIGLAARVVATKQRRLGAQPLVLSTLQSIRRGRPTEIDYLNGEIVRLGQEVGIPAPLNATAVALVHQVERTGTFLPADAVRIAVQQPGSGGRKDAFADRAAGR